MIRLQEIQLIFISQNRLVEGKDYVRAEWLKGTGGCYIDTLINPAWNDQLSATTNVGRRPTVTNPYILSASGTNTVISILLGGAWYKNNSTQFLVVNRVVGTDGYFMYASFPANAELNAAFKVVNNSKPTVTFKVNGAVWTGTTSGSNIITELPDTTYKIGRDTANGLDVLKLKNVKINSHNFMPCKLLRAIPAELDANGIARNAEECGMVDTYSGLFYGNVASSGSFTVENVDESGTVEDTRLHQIYTNKLVEGKDYKCYDWIERKSSAMGRMFSLALSNTADTVVRIWNYKAQGSNGRDMIYLNCTNGSAYFIYPDSNAAGQTLMRHSGQSTGTVIVTGQDVELKLRSGKVNNIYGLYAYKSIGVCPSTAIGNLTKVGRIYSDSYDYVPCKLLRAVPANRTMNGKSYPAGTMGMIEKVSSKFQPIANAATLTVSYDEWLKDCSIRFNANYLGWTMQYPPTITYKGRVRVANLPDELTDFGFVKLSKTQVVIGENVWSFNNWGSDTWATINVSYGGGGGCGCSINGSSVGSQQEQVATELSCSIDLQDIIQINEIEFIAYIDQQTTHTVKFTRGFDETLNKQYLISDYDNTRIYAN